MFLRLIVLSMPALSAFAQDGAALYKQHCAMCHETGANRAPAPSALKQMTPEAVLASLQSGKMKAMAEGLAAGELKTLATHVTGQPFTAPALPQGQCAGAAPPLADPLAGPHWNGWGVDLENHRFQPAAMARLTAADAPRLKLKWAFGFPNSARALAQPTVAAGRIFVGSAVRRVYSLDASSGCIYWTFEPDLPVRTAMTLGKAGDRWAIFFGDQGGNAYAVDAATGEPIWKTRVEAFPGAVVTGAPKLHEGRLYVPASSGEEVVGAMPKYECCKFRGSLSALDAATGTPIWKAYTIPEPARPVRKNAVGTQLWGPSGAGIWSSATIDVSRKAIYVSTGDSYSDLAARTSVLS